MGGTFVTPGTRKKEKKIWKHGDVLYSVVCNTTQHRTTVPNNKPSANRDELHYRLPATA